MKNLFKNTYKKFAILSAMVAICAALALPVFVHADNVGTPTFRSGDIVTAVNNTTRNADWSDPVVADPGQIIEYKILVQNMTPDTVAKDIMVTANFPTTPSKNPQVTMTANANGISVSDTATVNVSGNNTYLVIYEPGHSRVFSPACPNGCDADDSFRDGGPINIGDLAYGESAQVSFKAGITNPGPAASTSPAPSVAPSTPAASTTPNIQCPSGTTFQKVDGTNIICINNSNVNNNTNNNNSSSNQTQTVNVTAASTSPTVVVASNVKELPNTGLPLAGLALTGLTPLGLKLKKFGKGGKDALTPNFMWENREFNKIA